MSVKFRKINSVADAGKITYRIGVRPLSAEHGDGRLEGWWDTKLHVKAPTPMKGQMSDRVLLRSAIVQLR